MTIELDKFVEFNRLMARLGKGLVYGRAFITYFKLEDKIDKEIYDSLYDEDDKAKVSEIVFNNFKIH